MRSSFGNRLIAARKMAGLSLQGLADRLVGTTITRQALHKYELNQTLPNSQTLIALSKALQVPVDFFFADPEVSVELNHVEFRKRKHLSATAETAIREQVVDLLNRYLTLEKLSNEEKPVHPFAYPELVRTVQDAEDAAAQLRSAWGLGSDPIPNVAAMLEENGYKVVEVKADAAFDGMKAFAGPVRIIAVNRTHDICRIRFTALHELAHHVLVFPEEMPENERERLCHAFSGAVLLPAEQALEAMNEHRFHFYLPELILLKENWGISIAAMFARARNLGIINEYVYAKLNRGYRTRQYHLNEPGRYCGEEKTYRFDQLLYKALAEDIITINQAATLRNVTVGELRNDLDQIA
ncbi:MAG TPA: XRE family transcriptional regulator [Saprospiraceae bacterium]|nr:XRE family transcriptional regulator [Saprospiraceae bacterium]